MFGPITVPFGARLLFNTIKLKPGVSYDDVELALAEMCNVVKETYGGDKGGFIAGQVFRFSGFLSDEGSLAAPSRRPRPCDRHLLALVRRARAVACRCGVQGQVRGPGRHVRRHPGTRLRDDVAGRAGRRARQHERRRTGRLTPAVFKNWARLHLPARAAPASRLGEAYPRMQKVADRGL